MSSNLESFCPKLRKGKIVPQGSHIVFETENPYNQIAMPMYLADLILLCGGQFTVREIVEKIYKKQGAVPFKSILKALHLLHQGGFFENGQDLVMNNDLRSWMNPRHKKWRLAWRLIPRLVTDRPSPTLFYVVSLFALIATIFGLQQIPSSPLAQLQAWTTEDGPVLSALSIIICTSLLQTARYCFRSLQLLLLTGRAFNIFIAFSGWGIHLHLGDEANGLLKDNLYTTMFYISQILFGWACLFCLSPVLGPSAHAALVVASCALTFWETNPFISSDGLKLIQASLGTSDRELMSWHFDSSSLIKSLNSDTLERDANFVRICSIWATVWLGGGLLALHGIALATGPYVFKHVLHFDWTAILPACGIIAWFVALYHLAQAFVETLVAQAVRPWIRKARALFNKLNAPEAKPLNVSELIAKIQDLPLFSHFHENNLIRIIENSQVLAFQKGGRIITQGSASRHLYVLLDGDVEIIRNIGNHKEWLIELGAVSIFGEAALLDESPRGAEVSAKTPVSVLKLPVAYVRQVAEESHVVRHLNDFRNAILVNQFFSSSPVFRSLSRESVDFLCSRGALEYFDGNQIVFRQGDRGDYIYLVLRGSVMVEVHNMKVKRLTQGNFFGEISLIANIPRTGTIVTGEPCVFFKISGDAFWEILIQHMDLGVFLESVSESRLLEDLDVAVPLKATGSENP